MKPEEVIPWPIEIVDVEWFRKNPERSEQMAGYEFRLKIEFTHGEPNLAAAKHVISGGMTRKMFEEGVPIEEIESILMTPGGFSGRIIRNNETLKEKHTLNIRWFAKTAGRFYGSKYPDPLVDRLRDHLIEAASGWSDE